MDDKQQIQQLEAEAAQLEDTNNQHLRLTGVQFPRFAAIQQELQQLRARCTITQTPQAAVLLHKQIKHKPWDRTKVRCIDTGEVFDSAAAAAHSAGCGRSAMSNHLSGRHPHVRGKRYERINEE